MTFSISLTLRTVLIDVGYMTRPIEFTLNDSYSNNIVMIFVFLTEFYLAFRNFCYVSRYSTLSIQLIVDRFSREAQCNRGYRSIGSPPADNRHQLGCGATLRQLGRDLFTIESYR